MLVWIQIVIGISDPEGGDTYMPRSTRSRTAHKLDMMSITVLLVMAIFGGLIGFYIGQTAGASQVLNTVQTVPMMQAK